MTLPAILALDLGQQTGWALRPSDGLTTSGTVAFKPGRFEGGGMPFLEVMAAVRALGHKPADDNEADALALLDWAQYSRAPQHGDDLAAPKIAAPQ